MSQAAAIDELVRLRAELDHLGVTLSRDAAVAASHPELQFFATADQRMARIINTLRAQG